MEGDIQIEEVDAAGLPLKAFKYEVSDSDSGTCKIQTVVPNLPAAPAVSLLKRFMGAFLPAGYPATVTPDYTPYQIYDTLQAFASTIAGLLASRAVFVGMGVGDEDASIVTTMLLYIAQETIGRVATILFAHQFSQRIEAELKFYRFFADIVNDVAFVLDCWSPNLPVIGRVLTLCISNASRAVCGVAAGSSKAMLSSHFAKAGNIGELNAKDGSQETVVSLVGMWIGGLVVSRVHGTVATWCCLIPLLALHLWSNWKAVNSVTLTTLNPERAAIVFQRLMDGAVANPEEVGRQERFMSLKRTHYDFIQSCQFGASMDHLIACMSKPSAQNGQKSQGYFRTFGKLLNVFRDEKYLLWYDINNNQSVIVFKHGATADTQLKGFFHALRLLRGYPMSREKSDEGKRISQDGLNGIDYIESQLKMLNSGWASTRRQLEDAGWNLNTAHLEKHGSRRIMVSDVSEGRKEK